MILHKNRLPADDSHGQTILMKYHALSVIFEKAANCCLLQIIGLIWSSISAVNYRNIDPSSESQKLYLIMIRRRNYESM